MSFKSKAEMRKSAELVKQGVVTQAQHDGRMNATPDVHQLPERINPQHPKTPRIRTVGTTRVIK